MKKARPSVPALLFLFLTPLLGIPSHAADRSGRLSPLYVDKVPKSTALGFVNGPKMVVSSTGTILFSVANLQNGVVPMISLYRLHKWGAAGASIERLNLTDSAGLVVAETPHVAQSLCALNDGPAHLIWAGGNRVDRSDPAVAHQIRYARVTLQKPMKVVEQTQPFSVTGFERVYQPPYGINTPWQENPAAAITADGTVHVVWEARDPHHLTPDGQPISAIAYAARRPTGEWTVPATFNAPPYLDVKGVSGMQRRPFLLTAGGYPIHVFCYGDVRGVFQILYGQIRADGFSGWTVVAASDNDQRQITAALDDQGRVHAVWREAPPNEASNFSPEAPENDTSYLSYSVRNVDGKWSQPLFLGDDDVYASAPSLTIAQGRLTVAWIGWDPGFVNSDSLQNNNSPQDEDTVEGRLYESEKPVDGGDFSAPVNLTGGNCAYPTLARLGNPTFGSPLLVWTAGQECLPRNCIQLYLSTLRPLKK